MVLWEAYHPYSEKRVSFSRLFDRVDYDDRGNFDYDFRELEDPATDSAWARSESTIDPDGDRVVISLMANNRDAGHTWLLGYTSEPACRRVVVEWNFVDLEHAAIYARPDARQTDSLAGCDEWMVR